MLYALVFLLGVIGGWFSKTAVIAWVKKQTEKIGV